MAYFSGYTPASYVFLLNAFFSNYKKLDYRLNILIKKKTDFK